ncbi:hypothetical protein [Nocardia arthritidis]|uniref:Protein involved in plasmid replication-relaxation n=1 Tax=Nocardia arthritidis TaxID=228602 RepID=A0A6G9YCG2_9NOCA|nr:hypothetical protein [Nocardia arthritidis]QIS10757.1 hypothetical protein F5544_14355 [Nocardia arthritidis]
MSTPGLRVPQPRETRIEEFYCQQYGMSLASLVKAMERRPRTAYKLAERLNKAGRAHVVRLDYGSPGPWRRSTNFDEPGTVPQGPLWIYPTREIAWGYLDFDPGEWHPKPSTAAHLTAVTELRLALTGLETDPEIWTSERLLRRRVKSENGQANPHIHDAWVQDFTDPDKVWAIEVELTRKRGEGRLMRAMTAALDAADRYELAGVLYFVRSPELLHAVNGVATRIAHQRGMERLPNLEIHDLDATLTRKGENDGERLRLVD